MTTSAIGEETFGRLPTPLPSAAAVPCLWAVWRWRGKRRTASQKHTTAASSSAPPRPSAASPDLLSPRWRPRGSGWSGARCCGCCWAPVHPSFRWSCLGICVIRPGGPSPLCFPPPLSHQIPPRWTTGLASCSRGNASLQMSWPTKCAPLLSSRRWLPRCLIRGYNGESARSEDGARAWWCSLAGRSQQCEWCGRGSVCFTLSFLRLRRALVDAYVFSVLYWPVTAADVRGGGEKEAKGRCRGSVVYRWEEG